jgi:hypothetical protein
MYINACLCVFVHSLFIENPLVNLEVTNLSFLRWFCHTLHLLPSPAHPQLPPMDISGHPHLPPCSTPRGCPLPAHHHAPPQRRLAIPCSWDPPAPSLCVPPQAPYTGSPLSSSWHVYGWHSSLPAPPLPPPLSTPLMLPGSGVRLSRR